MPDKEMIEALRNPGVDPRDVLALADRVGGAWEHLKERASVSTEAWRVAIVMMLREARRGGLGAGFSVVANGEAREFYFKRPARAAGDRPPEPMADAEAEAAS